MRTAIHLLTVLFFSLSITSCTDKESSADGTDNQVSPQDNSIALAQCLAENGWVMYSSSTCSACLAQRKAFGDAFAYVTEIECNPHAPNTQVELCLEKQIRKTPTWILEKNGDEIRRVESYQLLEDLASLSDCSILL